MRIHLGDGEFSVKLGYFKNNWRSQ